MKSFPRSSSTPASSRALVRAVVGSGGVRLAGVVLSFLVGVQLARILSVEDYGTYSLAMSMAAMAGVAIQFGVPQLAVREVAAARAKGNWGRVKGIMSWSRRTILLTGGVLGAILLGGLTTLGTRLDSSLRSTLPWAGIFILIVALERVRGAILRGLQRIVAGQMTQVILQPAAFAFLLFTVFVVSDVPPSAPYAMALHVAAAALALGAVTWMLKQELPTEFDAAAPEIDSRGWRGSALPMSLTEGARVSQGHIVILLLGALASSAAVGVFKVAWSVAVVVAMPVALMNIVGAPIISDLYSRGERSELQRTASWLGLGMFAGVVILSIPFLVSGSRLLSFVFGSEYEDSLSPLLILCLGHTSSAFFGVNAALLNMTGNERRVTRAFLVAVAAAMLLGATLIPLLGPAAAAIAHASAAVVWNALLWRDAERLLGIDTSLLSLWRNPEDPR